MPLSQMRAVGVAAARVGRDQRRARIAIVTGAIAPYTNRLYDDYARRSGADLAVFTCAALEPDRQWQIPAPQHYRLQRLPGLGYHASSVRHVYLNPTVNLALARARPDVVIVNGFGPTLLLAGLQALATRTPLGIATDGTLATDPGRSSGVHRAMRRLLVPRAAFGICASAASVALLTHWGLDKLRSFVVPLVPAWDPPSVVPDPAARRYDVLFCGTLNDQVKGALFFAEVVERCRQLGRRLAVRVTGDGPLRATLEARFKAAGIEARFDGYLQQDRLAEAYGSARLFLFPTRGDVWGLVVNEAVQCGTPVIASPHAGASSELIERFGVGLVRPLEVEAWASTALDTLASAGKLSALMAGRAQAIVALSHERAVGEFSRAIRSACEVPN